MIDDIIGGFLAAALAPGGKLGEWLAGLLCLAAGIFSIAFGIWFAFVAVAEAPLRLQFGILAFFVVIALPCFYLLRRFYLRVKSGVRNC